jgi:DnaJ family protein C protein 9
MNDEADPALQFFDEGEVDLYSALGVTKEATFDEIKKAYRKQALRHHPDKQGVASSSNDASSSSTSAKATKFQQIGFAYSVLSSESRRSRYDSTGRTDESMFEEGMDWNAYFKELWTGEVNSKSLETFKKKYRRSDEEKSDILQAYTTVKGSLPAIIDQVPFLSLKEDRKRIEDIVEEAIKDKKVTRLKKWDSSRKDEKLIASALKKEAREEDEAMEMAKEMGVYDELFGNKKGSNGTTASKKRKQGAKADEDEDFTALQNIIAKRNEQRGGHIDGLIAKLEADAKQKGAAAVEDKEQTEPTDEEFDKIRAQLDASRSKKQKQKA